MGSTSTPSLRMEAGATGTAGTGGDGGGGDGGGRDGGDGGDAGTFTHPADVFRLGTTGGSWANLGVGLPDDHVDIKPDELARYVKPDYFFLNAARTGAVLKSHMDAATTSSGTHYGRVELRQLTRNKQKAAWKAAGTTFVVEYELTVDHIQPKKPWATLGQFHDSESDALAIKIKGDRTRRERRTTVEATTPVRRSRRRTGPRHPSPGPDASTIFQYESLRTTFPPRNSQWSHPRTRTFCPSAVVPVRSHSETPRSPLTQCRSSP